MVKWTTILVPDCKTNNHRWVKRENGQYCAICGVNITVRVNDN